MAVCTRLSEKLGIERAHEMATRPVSMYLFTSDILDSDAMQAQVSDLSYCFSFNELRV